MTLPHSEPPSQAAVEASHGFSFTEICVAAYETMFSVIA